MLTLPGRAQPIHLCAPAALRDRMVVGRILRRYPEARMRGVDGPRIKPPMRPSEIPALDGFPWTDIDAGLDALCAAEVAA